MLRVLLLLIYMLGGFGLIMVEQDDTVSPAEFIEKNSLPRILRSELFKDECPKSPGY